MDRGCQGARVAEENPAHASQRHGAACVWLNANPMKRILPLIGLCLPLMSLAADEKPMASKLSIERFDPAFDQLVASDAKVEKLAEGYTWSEGPVWFKGALLFSDVPQNVVYRWAEGMKVAEVFLKPSG